MTTTYPATRKYQIGEQRYTRQELDAFAVNPEPLFRQIDREADSVKRDDPALAKWQIINEALRAMAPPLPPQLRAALIRELATVPGVQVLDSDHDPAGRRAVGLSLTAQDVRDSVYFDRATSVTTYSIASQQQWTALPASRTSSRVRRLRAMSFRPPRLCRAFRSLRPKCHNRAPGAKR